MSDVLSQLNLVFGSPSKPMQGKLASSGDSAAGQVHGLFADEQANNKQQEQAGSRPGSFAALLAEESLEESESDANNLQLPGHAQLEALGIFYAEAQPEYSELTLGGRRHLTALIGKALPDHGENLPPHNARPVLLESSPADDSELGQLAADDVQPTETGELWHGLLQPGLAEDGAGLEVDDVFANLAFLPSAGPAAAAATQAVAETEAEGLASKLSEADAFSPVDPQQQARVKTLTAEQRLQMQASAQPDASKASASPLDVQQLRRSGSRDVEFDPQRLSQGSGGDAGSFEESRSPHIEGQLIRNSMAVEREHLLVAAGQARETASVTGQSATIQQSASQVTVVQADTATIRVEQQNSVTDQPAADSVERRILDMRLGTTVGKPQWGDHLGRQLTLMIGRSMDQASIQLDPPELGPMQIRLHLQQDQVSVQISAHHAVVRDAVEQSVVRLQQLFNEEGLELLQVTVSDEQSAGEGNGRHQGQSQEGEREENLLPTDDGNLTLMRISDTSDGKIDYFV